MPSWVGKIEDCCGGFLFDLATVGHHDSLYCSLSGASCFDCFAGICSTIWISLGRIVISNRRAVFRPAVPYASYT